MTNADLERVMHLIGLIYDAATLPDLWPAFATKLCEIIPSTDSNIYSTDVISGRLLVSFTMIPPEALQLYLTRYHQINPYFHRDIPQVQTGRISRSHEICPPEEFERTEFYECFFRPLNLFHVLNATILKESDIAGSLSLSRAKEADVYNDEEVHLLSLLLPHLQRAFRIGQLLNGLRVEREMLHQALDNLPQGAVIVNRTGRLIYANRNAELILARNDGLALTQQRDLQASFAKENTRLRQMITSAGEPASLLPAQSGGLFQLTRPSGLRPLYLLIAPLSREASPFTNHQPAVLIFISDPEQQTEAVQERLQQLYRLTPAEAKLAVILIRGNNTAAAAAELSITQNTARTHLKRIFQKTGTHRQSELVNLLLKSPATLK